jgi:hypothetical protein
VTFSGHEFAVEGVDFPLVMKTPGIIDVFGDFNFYSFVALALQS